MINFSFSYYGFATLFFTIVWIAAIYKRLQWWEYLYIAWLHCISYITSRDDWNWAVKLYLVSQLVLTGAVVIGLIVLFKKSSQ